MKQRFLYSIVLLVVCILMNSCAPNESAIATAIAETKVVEELVEAATQLADIQQAETKIPAESSPQTKIESPSESKTSPKDNDPGSAPNQELAAEFCPEGQELLYYEDFEDEDARGWYNIEDTNFSYELVEGRGKVLSMNIPEGFAEVFYLDDFFDAIWLIDVRAGDPPLNFSLDWHYQRDDENHTKSFYYTNFASGGYLQIHIAAPDLDEAQSGLVESAEPLPSRESGDWQRYAFSYFEGQVDLWLDGKFIAGKKHSDPIEYGGFGIRLGKYPETVSIDNVVVCSLGEPYTP